jgi:hypothetical protein
VVKCLIHKDELDSQQRLSILCKDGKGQITKWSRNVQIMNNGIEYYFVEVTCKDGIQYGIQAFGEEAIALHNEAMKMIQANLGNISTTPADINW